jgi:hypothetical protein
MFNTPFYHQITKKTIVAFGNLFSNIKVVRKNEDGSDVQTIAVPIAYAPKEKWVVRIEQDPELTNHTYTTLPRLSFEITGINYDPNRKTNRMSRISCGQSTPDGNTLTSTYAPAPYNIDISLYALTKTQEDGLQIVEQILPYFMPEFTMSIKAVPEQNVIIDVPIVLNSVSIDDQYDGDFQTRRFITWTMSFTLKTQMFGATSDSGIIRHANVDISNLNLNYHADGLDDGSITEQWTIT